MPRDTAKDPVRSRWASGRQVQPKSEQTRNRILEAAAIELSENGYSHARMQDIAARVGIGLSSLYYHFDNKEDLVSAMLAEATQAQVEAVHAAVGALEEATPYFERLKIAIRAHVLHALREDAIGSARLKVARQTPPHVREAMAEIVRAESAFWQRLFENAHASGEFRTDMDLTFARMALMGAMNFAVEWFRHDRRSPEDFAEEIIRMISGGWAADSRKAASAMRPPSQRDIIRARRRKSPQSAIRSSRK